MQRRKGRDGQRLQGAGASAGPRGISTRQMAVGGGLRHPTRLGRWAFHRALLVRLPAQARRGDGLSYAAFFSTFDRPVRNVSTKNGLVSTRSIVSGGSEGGNAVSMIT